MSFLIIAVFISGRSVRPYENLLFGKTCMLVSVQRGRFSREVDFIL